MSHDSACWLTGLGLTASRYLAISWNLRKVLLLFTCRISLTASDYLTSVFPEEATLYTSVKLLVSIVLQ